MTARSGDAHVTGRLQPASPAGLAPRLVSALYALSGFIALGYQVIWFRVLVDHFGSTNLTFVLVLCGFLGGLGAGALASGRLQRRIAALTGVADPLRIYGIIELIVAAAALLTIALRWLPADLFGHFPYHQDSRGFFEPAWWLQLWRIGIAAACVFIPCFFMGATFPLLCRAFPAAGRFPSSLYACNTLGACAALLAGEFLLLPALGHDRTFWLIIGANVALGAFFLARGRSAPALPDDSRSRRPREDSPAPDDHPSFWLTAAIVSGLICGSLEGDMFKRLWFLSCDTTAAMSFISMWAILGIFLASWLVRAASWIRWRHLQIALALAALLYWCLWLFAYDIRDAIGRQVMQSVIGAIERGETPTTGTVAFAALDNRLSEVLLFVGIFVFPAYFLASLMLPWVCNRVHARGRHLGLVYGLNTAAFCLGLIATGWLAPRVNIFYSLKLTLVSVAILAVFALLLREGARVATWKPLAAVAGLALACALTSASFDKQMFPPDSLPALHPVHAVKSNAAHTTFVVDDPEGRRLFFDSYSMSATNPGVQRYMRLMAHFPLLAQANPRSALLICFGVGNTASAIARHESIERIDVVDLNDKVFETAAEFAATNDGVDRDSRVTLIHDDGRTFLNLTDRLYDLVTSEPPPPLEDGVARLYSVEYYRSILAHLTPGGMMTQWLPVAQMPLEAVNRAIATFISVFPDSLLFVGNNDDLILMGGRGRIDLGTVERRFFASAAALRDLQQLQIDCPVKLLARVIQSDPMLQREYANNRLISDQRNDLAYLAPDPAHQSVVGCDVVRLLEDLGADQLQFGSELRGIMTHLPRLMGMVPDFPIFTLKAMKLPPNEAPAFRDERWDRMASLNAKAEEALQSRRVDDAFAIFQQSLAVSEDQVGVLTRVGLMQAELGRWEDALATWRRYAALGLGDGRGELGVGFSLMQLRRPREAIDPLRKATTINPGLAGGLHLLGDALANTGQFADALQAYDRALVLQPENEAVQTNRRRVLELLHASPAPPDPPPAAPARPPAG